MKCLSRIEESLWRHVELATLPLPEEESFSFCRDASRMVAKIARFILAFPFALLATLFHAPFLLCKRSKEEMSVPCDDLAAAVKGRKFLHGAAIAEYQGSGSSVCKDSQWAHFEKRHLKPEHFSGRAIGMWDRTEDVIAAVKELGLNCFRFSIEWSLIEPQQGVYNDIALQHYIDFCNRLLDEGIEPHITMHHFTHPNWYEERGGFERAQNIFHFGEFCQHVISRLPKRVRYITTINEPLIYAFTGYVLGKSPPGVTMDFSKGAKVVQNLLNAHTIAYRAIKRVRPYAKVGLSHQYLNFEAGTHFTRPVCRYLNAFVNKPFMQILRGETPRVQVPILANRPIKLIEKKLPLDFLGVQCYSAPWIDCRGSSARSGQKMTQMEFREFPQALYLALKAIHRARPNLPLHVTEFGIATDDPEQRRRNTRGGMACVAKAINENVPVEALIHWSLLDNVEWWEGYRSKNFGLFKTDGPTAPYERKPGADVVVEMSERLRA